MFNFALTRYINNEINLIDTQEEITNDDNFPIEDQYWSNIDQLLYSLAFHWKYLLSYKKYLSLTVQSSLRMWKFELSESFKGLRMVWCGTKDPFMSPQKSLPINDVRILRGKSINKRDDFKTLNFADFYVVLNKC